MVAQPIADIARNGIRQPVRWFPSDPWRIFADPFCHANSDGSVTVLAEMLSHWTGKGEIWSAKVAKGGDPLAARFTPYAVGPVHLSYPFLVQDGLDRYLIMESFEASGLFLWHSSEDSWHLKKMILRRPAVDATLYRQDGLWWLFCTFQDDSPNDRLHLFYSPSLYGDWTSHPLNPVKIDRCSARPAGALFMVDGMLIRPAQDCSHTYGGGLSLNQVVCLTPTAFEEVAYRHIAPVPGIYAEGIHTIAGAGDYTIIDGKRWHRGWAGNLASRVFSVTNRIQRSGAAATFASGVSFHDT